MAELELWGKNHPLQIGHTTFNKATTLTTARTDECKDGKHCMQGEKNVIYDLANVPFVKLAHAVQFSKLHAVIAVI